MMNLVGRDSLKIFWVPLIAKKRVNKLEKVFAISAM